MVLLNNASDAYIAEAFPDRNRPDSRKLYVQAGGGNQRYAFIFFTRPFPKGVQILDARLRLYNGSDFEAGATLSVNRVTSKWSRNEITWTDQPTVNTFTRTVTKSGLIPAGTEWEVEVTAVMQSVADGGKWFGFRITADNGAGEWFHSSSSTEEFRPTLEVTWADPPDAPEGLVPGGNRAVSTGKPTLSFEFTDGEDEAEIAALRVEIASTKAILEANNAEWKSGDVVVSEPELDLAATTYPGLASGSKAWWRAAAKDASGAWSPWSEPEPFRHVPLPAITLINPAPVPDGVGYVEDPTPPIMWNFPGQVAYQVILSRANKKGDWLWTTGKKTGTLQDITPPKKIIKRDDTKYNVRIRCWDAEDREKEGNRPIFAHISQDFTYNKDVTVDPVANLVATPATPYPWTVLTWTRAVGAADRYAIYRDGDIIDVVDSEEVILSDGTYRFYDRFASVREKHDWVVVAIVNKKSSKNNPTASATPRATAPWLMDDDGSDPIMLLNPNVDYDRGGLDEVHFTLGSNPPVLISQSVRGLEGHARGILANDVIPDLTAKEQRNRFKRLRRPPGKKLIFFYINETFECFINNAQYKPIPRADGTVEYEVSFDFYQTDF